MSMTEDAIKIATEWLPKKKLKHSVRVAEYAKEKAEHDIRISAYGASVKDVYVVGLLHDVVEDTDCTFEDLHSIFPQYIINAVNIVTKRDDEKYGEYIDRVIKSENIIAFIVKAADMKDHLAQTDTLTDKLKEKYLPHIAKFI